MCVLKCHAKDYRELCLSICEDVLKAGIRRNLKVFSVILYKLFVGKSISLQKKLIIRYKGCFKERYMRKILIGLLGYTFVSQQMLAQTDSIADTRELKAVVVKATNGIKSRFRVDNAEIIGQGQLIRAACCNLGESFTANPSVDVSYSDAATGAKQIKLLGLSGTYVQMLTENVPNLRGAALPYSLGYVPGPWMQSIQVSKGASSVKNGYESTTGQINIEFLKPQGTDGVRWDHSSRYGGFFTPRLHVKYSPDSIVTLRTSVGKGYRSPHALAENVSLLASGREIFVSPDLKQEEAWNTGVSLGFNIPLFGRNLELNAEYYYTNFVRQMIMNFDGASGQHTLRFENLDGKSYSHTLQVDATYALLSGMTATAAFRLNDVKCTYDGSLRQKPLTSRYKGLLTLSYKTPLELWQFDVTGQLNGGGELYDRSSYPAYFQLQAQVTREFHRFSLYLGGENLTNYKIDDPIRHAHHPWSAAFDATQVWGPVTGAMAYVGVRFKLEKL